MSEEEKCSHDCDHCASNSCKERKGPQLAALNPLSNVGRVVGVMSGKGGVGKSITTAMLAVLAQRKGLRVGILDADITGPSIPKIFGLSGQAVGTDEGILPSTTKNGIQVMSLNLLVPDSTEPVIWRGPILASAVTQFWSNVIWNDLDILYLDMPPGTGDIPLTIFQSIPVNGTVVVSTPQELVGQIVGKSVRMAEKMNIKVMGLVENMAYYECPDCHSRHELFGPSHLAETAAKYKIPATAGIPLDPELAKLCDAGRIEDFKGPWLDAISDLTTK